MKFYDGLLLISDILQLSSIDINDNNQFLSAIEIIDM